MITMLLSLLCACVCVTAGKPHLYFSNFAAPGPSPSPLPLFSDPPPRRPHRLAGTLVGKLDNYKN